MRPSFRVSGEPGEGHNDTWTWDGAAWTQRIPPHAPSPREAMSMAYDATHGQVVLFGGYTIALVGDTWTWDGLAWAIPYPAAITLTPSSGPVGTVVQVQGSGFGGFEKVSLSFIDSTTGTTKLATVTTDGTGAFRRQVTIPATATAGKQRVKAKGNGSGQRANRAFTVT